MSQDMISFGCPSCGVQLRVPSSMAGVQGPCPACGAPISAPQPEPEPAPPQPAACAPPAAEAPPAPAAAPVPLGAGVPTDPFPAGYQSSEPRGEPAPVSAYRDDPFAAPPAATAPASASAPRDPFGSGPITPLPGAVPPAPPTNSAPFPPLREPADPLPSAPPAQIPYNPFEAPEPGPSAPTPVASHSAPPYPAPAQAPTAAYDPFASPPPASAPPASEASQAPSAPSEPAALFGTPAARTAPDPFPASQDLAAGLRESLPNLAAPGSPGSYPQPAFAPARQEARATIPQPQGSQAPNPHGFLGSLELGEAPYLHGGGEPSSYSSSPAAPNSGYAVPNSPPAYDAPGGFSDELTHLPPASSPSPSPFPSSASTIPSAAAYSSPAAPDPFPAIPSSPPAPALPRKPGDLSPETLLPLAASHPHHSPMTPPAGAPSNEQGGTPRGESRRRLRWPGIVFPVLFLILAAIMVYLVLDLSELLPNSKVQIQSPTKPPASPNSDARRQARDKPLPSKIVETEFNQPSSSPHRSNPNPAAGPGPNPDPSTPRRSVIEEVDRHIPGEVPVAPLIDLDAPEQTTATVLPRVSSPPPTDPSDSSRPARVLEKFLAARSLEERLPYLTRSTRSDTVLAGSALARPFPEVVHRRRIPYVQDSSSKQTEHFFEVSFQMSPDQIPSPILVQLNEWGDGQVRVHTDAFLDLFNDEIGTFGRAPVPGERTFHVVADAYKNCFDENVPDAANKAFIKLRAHPRITPRLKAYFSKHGGMAEEISSSTGLPWGSSNVCTVTVKWNAELPTQPYVELVRINGFSTWNP